MDQSPRRRTVGPYASSSARGTGQRTFPQGFVLRLQQTVGNREVLRLLAAESSPAAAPVPRRARVGWVGVMRALLARARSRLRAS
jgi:hypothetical protein